MSGAKLLKDFLPIALTPVLAKRIERIVCDKLALCVQDLLGPLQFFNLTQHLDSANTLFLL